MTDKLLSLFAVGVLAAFLGILVWKVPRLDLATIVLITVLFVCYDFFLTKRN